MIRDRSYNDDVSHGGTHESTGSAWHQDLHSTTPSETRQALKSMQQGHAGELKHTEIDFDQAYDRLPKYVKDNMRRMVKEEQQQKAHAERKHSAARSGDDEYDFNRLPKYVQRNIRQMAKEEQQKKAQLEKKHAASTSPGAGHDEYDFDRLPKYVQRNIRKMAIEEEQKRKLEQAEKERLAAQAAKELEADPAKATFDSDPFGKRYDAPKDQPIHMTYDKASNAYITDDGYIIDMPKTHLERPSGVDLTIELERLAQAEKLAGPRPDSRNNSLVDLPDTSIDYKQLSKNVPVASLYGSGGLECADKAYTVGLTIWPFNRIGFLKTTPNKNCQLAQTVDAACTIPELIALDASQARTVHEQRRKSQAVVTAAKFCAETIKATEAEAARLKREDEDS